MNLKSKRMLSSILFVFIIQTQTLISFAEATPYVSPAPSQPISNNSIIKAIVSMILFVLLLTAYMLYMNKKASKDKVIGHYQPTRGRSGAFVHDKEEHESKKTEEGVPKHGIRLCPFCGAENPGENHFCGKCGSML